ncbi:MAG: response regulator [Patescibacteria group bacterium]
MSKKILIIEDEKSIARALELKFIHEGFDVICVTDGENGILYLEKETFDFILLDLIMPKINGFQVLETLNKKGVKIPPIVVLSNLSQADDEKRVMELGAIAFFVKSNISLFEIVEWVKKKLS